MNTLKKIILALALFTIIGCDDKEKTYTPSEAQHIVDSVMQIKWERLKKQADHDYQMRSPITIKALRDSILQADTSLPSIPVFNDSI